MTEPKLQTAILQSGNEADSDSLPLVISGSTAIPSLPSEHHVLVRVLAVALNPTDYKNPTHFPTPGQGVGSDFCGIVVDAGAGATDFVIGARVCGAVFPYSQCEGKSPQQDVVNNSNSGAFAEWVVADSRLLLRVPEAWDDLQGAALGGIGWGTVAVAMHSDALALEGFPSAPARSEPVLVYGGGTATGIMACQLLSLSGYTPIATTSAQSAALAVEFGAAGTARYTSAKCAETVRELSRAPIRHALDCITSPESVATTFAAMARTGGRYACLEALDDAWRTRRLIRVKEVMGYEGLGHDVRLGPAPSTYSRDSNPSLFAYCRRWRDEVQGLLDAGSLRHHPVREVPGAWDGIIEGLVLLKNGQVRGHKLVVRVAAQTSHASSSVGSRGF